MVANVLTGDTEWDVGTVSLVGDAGHVQALVRMRGVVN